MTVQQLISELQQLEPTATITVGNCEIESITILPAYYDGKLKKIGISNGRFSIRECGTVSDTKVELQVRTVEDVILDRLPLYTPYITYGMHSAPPNFDKLVQDWLDLYQIKTWDHFWKVIKDCYSLSNCSAHETALILSIENTLRTDISNVNYDLIKQLDTNLESFPTTTKLRKSSFAVFDFTI